MWFPESFIKPYLHLTSSKTYASLPGTDAGITGGEFLSLNNISVETATLWVDSAAPQSSTGWEGLRTQGCPQ